MAFFQIFFINLVVFEMSKRINSSYLSCSRSENVKQSNQIDIYLTSIAIGQKSTNQIAQYMVVIWRGFRTLFTLVEARMVSMDFGSLQKEFLGALPSGFEGMKRLASQKVKEITPLVDVQPSLNTRGKLLLWVFIDIQQLFKHFEMWADQRCRS